MGHRPASFVGGNTVVNTGASEVTEVGTVRYSEQRQKSSLDRSHHSIGTKLHTTLQTDLDAPFSTETEGQKRSVDGRFFIACPS